LEISKELYEEGEKLLSLNLTSIFESNGYDFVINKQMNWILKVGLDLYNDNHFSFYPRGNVGKFLWEDPNKDSIIEFIEQYIDNPKFRLKKFNFDGKLSIKETKDFKDYTIQKHADPDNDGSVYIAIVKFEKKQLIIFSTRFRDTFGNIGCALHGIFNTYKEGRTWMGCDTILDLS